MMRISSIAVLLLFCGSLLKADLLDDASRQLDQLEKEYWRSQYSNDGEYRRNYDRRLHSFVAKVNRISRILRSKGKMRVADIATPAGALYSRYGKMKMATIRRFSLVFNGTSMRDYTREFRKYLREKEETEAANEAAKEETKGKKKKRSRSRVSSLRPTLANVNLVEYERWIAEVTAENMDKFLSRKNNGTESERNKMNDAVSEYMTAIQKIRIGLVKIRQQVKIEFK